MRARLGAAGEEVRHEAERAEDLHAVLRGLGLLLADDAEDGDERDVDEAKVPLAHAELELAERLDERHGLDVAWRGGGCGGVGVRWRGPWVVGGGKQRRWRGGALGGRRADGAAELDDAHVRGAVAAVAGDARDALDPLLDGVGDVRYNLAGGGATAGGARPQQGRPLRTRASSASAAGGFAGLAEGGAPARSCRGTRPGARAQ